MTLQEIRERVDLIAGGRATDPDEALAREIVLYRTVLTDVLPLLPSRGVALVRAALEARP